MIQMLLNVSEKLLPFVIFYFQWKNCYYNIRLLWAISLVPELAKQKAIFVRIFSKTNTLWVEKNHWIDTQRLKSLHNCSASL